METSLKLRQYNTHLILDFTTPEIVFDDLKYLVSKIKHFKNLNELLINMKNISNIDNKTLDFFGKINEELSNWTICFYNLSPILNTIFYIFNIDKKYQLYLLEKDALTEQRPLVRRRFKVVSC